MGYIQLFLTLACVIQNTFGQDEICSRGSLTVNPGADVKFTVILTLRQSTDGRTCGTQLSTQAIQYLAVMEWAVNEFNVKSAIKLGFDVHDDCGLPWKSIGHALDVLNGPVLGSDACVAAVNTPCQIGIVGTTQSVTTEAILHTIANMSLPVITPYVTTEGMSRHLHFYRTITPDDVQIQAILSTMRGLGLTFVAVVSAGDEFSQYVTARLRELGHAYSICIDVVSVVQTGGDIDLDSLTSVRKRAKNKQLTVIYIGSQSIAEAMFEEIKFHKAEMANITWLLSFQPPGDAGTFPTTSLNNGTITITPSYIHLPETEAYVNSKWRTVWDNNVNKTTTDAIRGLMECTGRTTVPKWSNRNILPTIDALFSLGYALQRQTLLHGCNMTVPVCEALKRNFRLDIDKQPLMYNDTSVANITELAQTNRSILFRADGEIDMGETTPLFDISLSTPTGLIKFGEYRNQTFNVDASAVNMASNIIPSTCSEGCESCLHKPDIEYIYLDGDSLLLGIVSVHETDPGDPFKCGEFRLSQLDVLIIEGFMHALELARNETGINFGALIIDDCYSAPRTELVLSQLMSGKVTLNKPNSTDIIDVKTILAVVSVLGSTVTKTVATLMNTLNIPVITASASSKDLDDRINYPYFLRTVPSDEEQAKCMISIIQKMSWQYVSLMFVENNYGKKGMDSIVTLANASGICIANSPEGISEVGEEDSVGDLIASRTTLNNQNSNVVVYFGTERRISDFLTVLRGTNDFIFLASEDWGDRSYMLDKQGQSAKGSITLKNEVAPLTDHSFMDFIGALNPKTNLRNPWFVEYWEKYFQCDLQQSFHFKYSKPCADNLTFTKDTVEYFVNDQRIVHTVDAVRAVTKGLKQSKDKHCVFEDTFPCTKYFEFVPEVVQYIREVKINRGGVQTRVFKDDGNGNIGFTINNVQEVAGQLNYVKVGSYDEGNLQLDTHKLNFGQRNVDGSCMSTLCDHCLSSENPNPIVEETTTHSHADDEEFGVPDYTIIGILGFLCLLIIVFGIVIICYFRRRVKELEAQLKKTCYEMKTGYLTTTYRTPERKKENGSLTYPEMQFVGSSSGTADDTLYDWKKAQYQLAGGGNSNGYINKAFVGSESHMNSRNLNGDENQNYSNGSQNRHMSPSSAKSSNNSSGDRTDSSPYNPSSSSYGLTSHSSFKRVGDSHGHVKKQPRTQLAVPPCRPELPPRDQPHNTHAQRPDVFPGALENLPTAVPKDKPRNRRGSPKRTVSPPSFKTSPSGIDPPYLQDKLESPRYKGFPLINGIQQGGLVKGQEDLLNVGGSLEKISRV